MHCLKNGDLAVCWSNPLAFGILCSCLWYKEKIYFTEDKSGRRFKSFDYMAVDKKRHHVLQPCTVDKAVYCFDFEGQPVFKYRNTSLQCPRGAAVDDEGRTYVCELTLNCIHVISPNGIMLDIIKRENGCPDKPIAIEFDQNTRCLAVSHGCHPWASVYFFTVSDAE